MSEVTSGQVVSAVMVIKAVAEAIRDSGTAGVHVLRWTGGEL